jgi:hypothetical protein
LVDVVRIKELIFSSPYLNGGLFDIHPNDWCNPGQVNNAFNVPDHLFLDDEKGLNCILSRYKFTIAENTPSEEEIAVDPEMLGRIFENLLAEQSDDTKEAARKNIGAFYTPRPVVSYMCRNSLMKHLGVEIVPENSKKIIHKLLETAVLDPACGSGAFPMGMLEEMMQVLDIVDPEGTVLMDELMKTRDDEFRNHISKMYADSQIRYIKKLGLLRNCLFGTDILEYAIEITKLRCWLSLIVEQRADLNNKVNYNLEPLPNLDFKFYKKNTLYRRYNDENLNDFIKEIDKEDFLKELDQLENKYFITKSDRYGTKEEIKNKIIVLLENVIQSKYNAVSIKLNSTRTAINQLVFNAANQKEINKLRKRETAFAKEINDLGKYKDEIKDYLIERVVFPGIFNKESDNPGFDIIIGNPPYVNTKLINKMGIANKLEEEYGYCDDLYNHFTIRGLELLKKGGILSYITSDTFLTLQTKKNMRKLFLGVDIPQNKSGTFDFEETTNSECHVLEIINTPKAFAALVDTAIFTIQKGSPIDEIGMIYVDLRKPTAISLNLSETEWIQIKTSKENLAGWESVLDKTFSALDCQVADWQISHYCDGNAVKYDKNSSLLKFRIPYKPYREAINYSIFSPTHFNCQVLEKIIMPARLVFDNWWDKIETSKEIERNRTSIKHYINFIKPEQVTLIGLLVDGGQGLATGNNGTFVGFKEASSSAIKCKEQRTIKLWVAIQKYPEITDGFIELSDCNSLDDVHRALHQMQEEEIWRLFDDIKQQFGLRIFGKGFMYRIIPNDYIVDARQISDNQKATGISGSRCFVPYDKGDREGNRWYSETPYLIDWSEKTVQWFKNNSGKSDPGMPVLRNPQFYFRNGFSWTNVLNPNSSYFKCRLKGNTVNDVGSMSLYDESGFGDKYFVTTLNSYLHFKILREFFNNTVNVQINDIRKLPIKKPTNAELEAFNQKFDACYKIMQSLFSGAINRKEAQLKLRPIETEIDEMVNQLYGIDVKEEVDLVEVEDEVIDVEGENED